MLGIDVHEVITKEKVEKLRYELTSMKLEERRKRKKFRYPLISIKL